MSYTFAFWAGGDDLDPRVVYARLNDHQHIPGVVALDRQQILEAVSAHPLDEWRWDGHSILQPPGADPAGAPAFDVAIGEQLVEFVAYGWEPEHANAIIDAMHSLGLRLYDPQVDERFA
ncbi:hypothetical protein [Williamsia sp. M5A3_1d]